MSGRIMPAPLAMPVTTASPPESFTLRENAFGTVSVVMMASAASSQLALLATAARQPGRMRSTGSGSMMTPVENGRTWVRLASELLRKRMHNRQAPSPTRPFRSRHWRCRCSRRARGRRFFRCFFARITGAAQKRFCVNTPATAAPGARRITSRSLRFGFRMPAMAMPSSTPGTG